jgi:hypothetical protein
MKRDKSICILLFMLLFTPKLLAQCFGETSCKADSIIIEYVDRDIMTIVSISCDEFDTDFSTMKRSVVLKDIKHIIAVR